MKILKGCTKKRRVRQEGSCNGKGDAYKDLYARLETKEGEKELYRSARQRDRAGKDVLHLRVMKDENSNMMVSLEEC